MAKTRSGVEQALVGFAEDLGRVLGKAQKGAEEWLGQRKQIGDQLRSIQATASQLLTRLGEGTAAVRSATGIRRGRPPGSKNTKRARGAAKKTAAAVRRGARKGRVVSEATRRKMRAAWARRKKAAAKA